MEQPKKVAKKRNSLEHALRDYRSRMATEEDVFKALEGDYTSSFENLKEFTSTELKKIDFCKKYIIKVVLDFEKNPISRDLILAIYGLLAGYETIPQTTKRRDAYCDIVGIHDKDDDQDKPYSAYWHKIKPDGTIDKEFYRNITSKEETAIRNLTKSIRKSINTKSKTLGYASNDSKVAEITKMTYPKPSYLYEEVYRKCTYEGKVFYVPLSEQELVKKAQHMILEPEEADTAEDPQEEEQMSVDNGDGIDTEEDTDSLINPLEPSPSPTPPPVDPPNPPKSPNKSRVISMFTICFLIFFAIGAIAYITSPLWSGNDTDKGNEEGIEDIYGANGEGGDDVEGTYDSQVCDNNGDTRPSYTINEINAGVLGNQITFNAISDSVIGNEKDFVSACEATNIDLGTDDAWNGTEIQVEDGKNYIIRLYVHNNSLYSSQVAENTSVLFNIPGESSTEISVQGFIRSSNAVPSEYCDSVTFKGISPFHLEYQYGSALLENNGIGKNGGIRLGDSIVVDNTLIGFDALDGRIPGCYSYDSFVYVEVKAVFEKTYTINNQVRLADNPDKTWKDTINAYIGDIIEIRIAYKNNSSTDQSDIIISDILPESLKYIEGSTRLVNAVYPEGEFWEQDCIAAQGINIGGYTAGSNAFVRFRAEVVDVGLELGWNALQNRAQGSIDQTIIFDSATILVCKE